MKMKLWMMVALMMVVFSSVGQATPVLCSTDSMASYIGLGSGGCQIDDKIFFNFGYTGTEGAPLASQITITPDPTPLNPGLFFTGGWFAGPGQFVASMIRYTVQVLPGGHLIKDNSLGISGVGVQGPGSFVTVSENKCKDGVWDDYGDCSAGPGNVVNLNVIFNNDPAPPPDSTWAIAVYPAVGFIDVIKDITLVGDGGFAHLSEVSQHFSEQIPEPGALLLLGAGLVGIVFGVRRKG